MDKRTFIQTFVLNAAMSATRARDPLNAERLVRQAELAWKELERCTPEPLCYSHDDCPGPCTCAGDHHCGGAHCGES